jgi:hypothetical protein
MGEHYYTDLEEIGCQIVDWIHLAQDMASSCEHGSVPLGYLKTREFLDQLSDYKFVKHDSTLSWN